MLSLHNNDTINNSHSQIVHPLVPDEWVNNTEWLAKRLVALWNLAERDPIRYSDCQFGVEKEELYTRHPEAVGLALKISR